jgi:hypothetical protein
VFLVKQAQKRLVGRVLFNPIVEFRLTLFTLTLKRFFLLLRGLSSRAKVDGALLAPRPAILLGPARVDVFAGRLGSCLQERFYVGPVLWVTRLPECDLSLCGFSVPQLFQLGPLNLAKNGHEGRQRAVQCVFRKFRKFKHVLFTHFDGGISLVGTTKFFDVPTMPHELANGCVGHSCCYDESHARAVVQFVGVLQQKIGIVPVLGIF